MQWALGGSARRLADELGVTVRSYALYFSSRLGPEDRPEDMVNATSQNPKSDC